MPRKKSENLTVDQEKFVRMEANGYSREEIILELFGIGHDEEGYHAAECKLSRWSDHPKYEEVWRNEVRKQDFGDYTKARKTLRRSMDDTDKWLAMQSAVNVLNNSGKRIFGAEENAVTVHIEGLPDIGAPDDDDG
jgi:hypothetical protein